MPWMHAEAQRRVDSHLDDSRASSLPHSGLRDIASSKLRCWAHARVKEIAREVKKYQPQPSSLEDRERLILDHLHEVRVIAKGIHHRLPKGTNLDDLISTGTLGLIAAVDHFDSRHNVTLKTYAQYKIRGAILDGLRRLDWAPRQQRKRSKQIDAAIAAIEQRLNRAPTEEEIAKELGLTLVQYHKWLVGIRCVNIESLGAISPEGDEWSLLKYISHDEENWPSHLAERSELQGAIVGGIEKLPPIEKIIISLHYYGDLTLREISKMLRLDPSRISQVKSQAILRLRSYLENRGPVKTDLGLGPVSGDQKHSPKADCAALLWMDRTASTFEHLRRDRQRSPMTTW